MCTQGIDKNSQLCSKHDVERKQDLVSLVLQMQDQLDARDRTVLAYAKTFAPYAATIAAIIVAIVK